MKCKKCESKTLEVKQVSVHRGVYCKDCGSWLKWVSKDTLLKVCPLCGVLDDWDSMIWLEGLCTCKECYEKRRATCYGQT